METRQRTHTRNGDSGEADQLHHLQASSGHDDLLNNPLNSSTAVQWRSRFQRSSQARSLDGGYKHSQEHKAHSSAPLHSCLHIFCSRNNHLLFSEFYLTFRLVRSLDDSSSSIFWKRSHSSQLDFLRTLHIPYEHTHRRSTRALCNLAHRLPHKFHLSRIQGCQTSP